MNTMLHWLIETGWQSAVMTVVLGMLLLVMEKHIPAAWRYGILFLIVVRLLLPALPQAPLSAYRIVPATPARAWEQALPGNLPPTWIEPPPGKAGYASPGTLGPAWDWSMAAGLVWISGVLFLSAWVVVRQVLFFRNLQRCRQAPSEKITSLLAETASLAGLRHPPRICSVEGLASPALTGWFKPLILLPAGFQDHFSEASLRFVLLHECVHLRRADLWTHALSMVAALLHWWNPAVWWLMARLHAERELATDAGVLEILSREDRRAYGETLMNLAERGPTGVFPTPSLGVLEKHAVLRRRIRQIAGFGRAPLIGATLGILLLATLAVALLVREPAPSIEPVPTDTQAREQVIRDFFEKVREGDLRAADNYLKRGLDVNSSNHYINALYWAVTEENLPMVELLLRRGARVDDKTSSGDTSINRACWLGNKRIADVLIAAGAKPNPLLYAAGMGDLSTLEKRQAEKPLTGDELKKVAQFSVAANQQPTFDWAWNQLSATLDEPASRTLLNDYLPTAATWGRLAIMKHVVSLGADASKTGKSALARAVTRNHVPEAVYLMDLGVSLATDADDYRGLLGDAAGEGYPGMVKALLDHGAAIDEQDKDGMTALAWAAYCRHDEVCALLIERGANVSLKDKRGESALWHAAMGGNSPKTAELLLKRGADPGGVNAQGSPILTAMQRFSPPRVNKTGWPGKIYTQKSKEEQEARTQRVVELLIKGGADPNAAGTSSPTPLIAALTGGHPEIALVLIRNGAYALRRDSLGNTPMSYVFHGLWGEPASLDVIRALLDKGADPNTTFVQPNTTPVPPPISILEQALALVGTQHQTPGAKEQTQKAISLLLSQGAKFPSTGGPRTSEWLAAAATGDLPRLRRLHKAGANINTATPQGWNALSIALALGLRDEAAWLMDAGIDLSNQASMFSPLCLAAQTGDEAVVKRILATGAKPRAEVMAAAAATGNFPLFEALRNAGGDASHVPLWQLVRDGSSDILRVALESGADAKTNTNPENRNNVYWAVYYNQPECLKLLLDYGTPPNMKDSYGQTPLEYAKTFRPHLVPFLEAAIQKAEAAKPARTPSS